MRIETSAAAGGSLDGEARRHLQTLSRRRLFIILPFVLGLLAAFLSSRGGEDTFVTSSIVRVPDPSQSSVFSSGSDEASSSDTDRIIASAIQLIRGNEVDTLVRERLGDDRFEQISLIDVVSVEDTLFVSIGIGSLDPQVAVDASAAFASTYVAEQRRLDVFDLETRATQLRQSADDIDGVIERIDAELSDLEEEIVRRDFEIKALESQLVVQASVPQGLVDLTIARNDFDRNKEILLGERSRRSQEQTFLRQEASNLDIEASYRSQTGAQIVAEPETPTLLQSRSVTQDLVLFGLIGLMFGAAAALVAEYFDSRVKSSQDLHDIAPDVPIIGAVPKVSNLVNQPHLAVATGRPWYAAEAYRALRTTLLAVHGRQRNGVVISSVGAGAGKSVTVTNLAVSLAKSGFKVLVIDANLRRPSIHMKLGVPNEAGTAKLLAEMEEPERLVQRCELAEWLHVLPAGPVPDNPAELLGSPSMNKLLRWGIERYDWVLVDSPPLEVFTDAAVVAHQLGGVILVVRYNHTDRRHLAEVLDQMETSGVPVLGFIVNGRNPAQSRAQRYTRAIGTRNLKTLWTDRPTGTANGAPHPNGTNGDYLPSANGRPTTEDELQPASASSSTGADDGPGQT